MENISPKKNSLKFTIFFGMGFLKNFGPRDFSCMQLSKFYKKIALKRLPISIFVSGIDPENDPRPECEYGLDCYRKNPQHKIDFKHTFNPRPKRRVKDKATAKAKKAKKSPTTNDEEDYDSSFIDDDEDDTDEADISNDEESVDEWTPDDDDDY